MTVSAVMLLLALSGSGRWPPIIWDECHDAALYAGAAAEARDAGRPPSEVFERDLRAFTSTADLAWRIVGLRLGYETALTPDEAAAAAFQACLTVGDE